MFYRPRDNDHGLKHNPFKALVAPRPIAWVSTLDSQGRANLAPFSFFNAVAEAPPILMFAAYGKKALEPLEKDTPRNVLETGEFVVNVVPAALKGQMNTSAAAYPAGVDEFEAADLTKADSLIVAPPRVAQSPVAFECKFLTRVELPSTNPAYVNGAIFGEVVGVHIADEVIADGRVDVTQYQPLARLGYMDYAVVDETFSMPRPPAPPS
ncbi:MAG: flavin reductase family protein [Rhodobacteraceae bacterium]|nr:flavin reductase family protein [Paracoccaceae bacterium]